MPGVMWVALLAVLAALLVGAWLTATPVEPAEVDQ